MPSSRFFCRPAPGICTLTKRLLPRAHTDCTVAFVHSTYSGARLSRNSWTPCAGGPSPQRYPLSPLEQDLPDNEIKPEKRPATPRMPIRRIASTSPPCRNQEFGHRPSYAQTRLPPIIVRVCFLASNIAGKRGSDCCARATMANNKCLWRR